MQALFFAQLETCITKGLHTLLSKKRYPALSNTYTPYHTYINTIAHNVDFLSPPSFQLSFPHTHTLLFSFASCCCCCTHTQSFLPSLLIFFAPLIDRRNFDSPYSKRNETYQRTQLNQLTPPCFQPSPSCCWVVSTQSKRLMFGL